LRWTRCWRWLGPSSPPGAGHVSPPDPFLPNVTDTLFAVLTKIRSTRLYERISRYEIVHQFVKYAIVGFGNVVIFLALFNTFRFLGLPEVVAYVAAFVPTNINSFFLNKRWAFRDQRERGVHFQYIRFAAFTIGALVINTVAFRLFLIPLDRYGTLGENIAALLPLPLSIAWNFATYRFWTFNSPRSTSPSAS
jgi:putative flippase GtrA